MMQENPLEFDNRTDQQKHAAKVREEKERISEANRRALQSTLTISEEVRTPTGFKKLEPRSLDGISTNGRNHDDGASVTESPKFTSEMNTPVEAILNERKHTHGDFQQQSAYAQTLKDTIKYGPGYGRLSNVARESLDMICVKISRIMCGDPLHQDSWDDIAGYATLVSKTLQ